MAMTALNVISRRPTADGTERPPLLLVHGAWHGAWCWEPHFLPFFAGHGYEVRALDLRGHGQSAATKAMRWNRIRDYVDDVASIARSFDRPPFVIGHSMGGLICQHLAGRGIPLAGLGLLSTVPSFGVWKTALDIALRRPFDFLAANFALSLYPLVKNPAKARHMFLDAETPDAETRAFAAKLSDESYLGFLDMLVFDLPRRKPDRLPMLIVGGGRDTIFAPATQHHTARYHGCECHIVEGAAHDGMLSRHWQEQAELFVSWMGRIVAEPEGISA